MSSLAAFANLDVDKLIADISTRPQIYDKNFNGRQNKGLLEETWDELALIHQAPKKIIKAKWKGLRDNFRIQWKMIPRDENDCLLISPEEFTGTKWQYYRPLLFLADNMGKSRNSYNHYDDNSYELLQQFEPAIEIPSDDEIELKNHDMDSKSGLSPKLHQRLTKVKNEASPTENSSPSSSPPPHSKSNSSRLPPKLRAIPHMNLMEVQALLARSTVGQVGQTTISPAPMPPQSNNNHPSLNNHQPSSNAPSSSTQPAKRRKTDDGVTTTGTGNSSDEFQFPTASSPVPNNDDDYHFLMSLQPYLNQFNGPQKLKIRMRIQKMIFKELYQEDFDD